MEDEDSPCEQLAHTENASLLATAYQLAVSSSDARGERTMYRTFSWKDLLPRIMKSGSILGIILYALAVGGCDFYREMQAHEGCERAQKYEQEGQYEEAIREWKQVLQLRPESSSHKWLDHRSYGGLLMRIGKYTEAAHVYEGMIKYMDRRDNPDPFSQPRLDTFLYIASAYAALGQTQIAVDYLTQASVISPEAMFIASHVDYFDPIRDTPEYQALHKLYFEAGKQKARLRIEQWISKQKQEGAK